MQQITPEFIKQCLLTATDYKNTRLIKQALQDNQENTFEIICNTIKEVLNWDPIKNFHPPMAKLYALRLSKDLIDIFNMRFVNLFEALTLESLKYYAEYGGPNTDPNRGTNLFGENMEKDIRQIGMSLVRLALECIHAWAQFFPSTPLGSPTKFIQLYNEIKNKGYQFPAWTYYKEDFVISHKSEKFSNVVDLLNSSQQEQPIKIVNNPSTQINPPISQTPVGQTPGDPKLNIVQKSNLVIQRCHDLINEVGDICSHNLNCDPKLFDRLKDEAIAKNQEMDILVNELIDQDEEDLAAEVMLEMDNLQTLEKDLNALNQKTNQEFRKKYMKNRPDYALQQYQIQQQQEQQRRQAAEQQEAERLARIKQQAIQDENEKERLKQIRQRELDQENQRNLEILKKQKEDEELKEKQRQEQERKKKEEEKEKEKQIQIQKQEDEKKKEKQEQELKEKEERERKIKQEEEQMKLKKLLEEEREKKKKEEEEQMNQKKKLEEEENLRKQKQHEEELKKQREYEEEQKRINQEEINKKQQQQENQIVLNNSDEKKALELIGANKFQYSQIQSQGGDQQQFKTSQFQHPMDRSQVQMKIQKPISHSSLGLNPQPQIKKINGDLSGAPDLLQENKQQMNQFEKKQLEILQQQVENLQRDKGQLQKQLEEEENRNKKLKEDVYQLNGGGNRISEDLKSLQTKFDQLQQEKILIQNQLTSTLQQFNEYKSNSERLKQQQKDQNDLELNNYKIERQQLFSEKQALLRQLDQLKAQSTNHVEIQDKQFQNEQVIAQQKREIENLKQEKEIIQKNLQKEIDLSKIKLNDQQSFSDTLNNQLNIYKTQLEKSQKDYLILQESQKRSNDELLQQVFEARRENLATKQQLNSIQLQYSDKEAEYKQLQQSYQAVQKENQQLKKNLESAQQQIDQFIQKNMDNRSSTLLQQKLQQKLDEIDKLKEDHKIILKEKDEYYKQRIDDLTQDRQKLQKDVFELQQQAQQNQLATIEAIQKQNQLQLKMPPKNHSKSQVSELESIQHQQNNQQIEISEVQGKANISIKEVNAAIDNNPIIQVQCPIAVFKHFPKNKKFYPEQIPQKSKNINAECLDLIFPYSSPEDYFNNKPQKQRKGKVIQSNQNFDDISHLNKDNLTFYKQRCLGSQGILYEEYGLQFGLLYSTQVSQNKTYFTYGLYIQNTQGVKQDFTVQFLEVEKFQQFWASPQEFIKTLDEDSNDLIEILIGSNKIPQQILTLQISHYETHPFQIYIPNHICQQIIYREIKVNEFKNKWKQYITNQIRTPLLNLNKGVMKDIYNFQKQIPKIIILNNNKVNDFELGIDEIKLGGLGYFLDIQFLIKFEILPNDKICIYLSFESKYNTKRQILEQILNGYAFILGDGKSL
ncbi:unnamed protein product [Paramecium primaurelia]|uniref:Uncharacterized protein n=1 Tax=Paramecium primaurelia TaxID=5886 RepID=A0A8S1ML51_PARPR|nr:unnamed protein product [Paramecium primaurelia]